MKILVINSDIPYNRGDRAIFAGNIKLIRKYFPKAELWGISNFKIRDEKWYGVNFLPMAVQSLNPVDLIKLVIFSRKCDLIFWGGGEILKDYTNKLALYYWVIKIFLIFLFNRNIYGLFQGIGPTYSNLSKKMIVLIVNRTKLFISRDETSKKRLRQWGAKTKIISSYDPAVLMECRLLTDNTLSLLKRKYMINQEILDNFVGMGPRNWFHYKKASWLPFRYKFILNKNCQVPQSPESRKMYLHFAKICDWIIETYNTNIVFFPMHVSKSEGDAAIAKKISSFMKNKHKTRVIDSDSLSPQEYLNVIGRAKLYIGIRLHSAILSTICQVPSMVFYYVDKGREYFKQINCEKFALPIEKILDFQNLHFFKKLISELWSDSKKINNGVQGRLAQLRVHLDKDFEYLVEEIKRSIKI